MRVLPLRFCADFSDQLRRHLEGIERMAEHNPQGRCSRPGAPPGSGIFADPRSDSVEQGHAVDRLRPGLNCRQLDRAPLAGNVVAATLVAGLPRRPLFSDRPV